MRPITTFLLLALLSLGITSCSIQKRHYMDGYDVRWNNNAIKPDSKSTRPAGLESGFVSKAEEEQPIVYDSAVVGCDLIVLKDGNEISAMVTEIGLTEIKYKKCDNVSGPTIVMLKSDVFMIKYANGTKDVIGQVNTASTNTTPARTTQTQATPQTQQVNQMPAAQQDSVIRTYYANGNLKMEAHMRGSQMHGWSKMYYEDGTVMSETNYVNGKPDGISKTYNESGRLVLEMPYKNGEITGVSKHYDSDGDLTSQANYLNGKLDGLYTLYNSNGTPSSITRYRNGEANGIAKYYNSNGKFVNAVRFENGTSHNIWTGFKVLYWIAFVIAFSLALYMIVYFSMMIFLAWAIAYGFMLLFKYLHKKQLESMEQ